MNIRKIGMGLAAAGALGAVALAIHRSEVRAPAPTAPPAPRDDALAEARAQGYAEGYVDGIARRVEWSPR